MRKLPGKTNISQSLSISKRNVSVVVSLVLVMEKFLAYYSFFELPKSYKLGDLLARVNHVVFSLLSEK